MDEGTDEKLLEQIQATPHGGTLVVRTSETELARRMVDWHGRADLGILSMPDDWETIDPDKLDDQARDLLDEVVSMLEPSPPPSASALPPGAEMVMWRWCGSREQHETHGDCPGVAASGPDGHLSLLVPSREGRADG